MPDPRAALRDLLAVARLWQAAAFPQKAATSSGEDYDVIRADLVNRVEEAFMDFVSQSGSVTRFRNAAQKAVIEDVPAAFERGYRDAGGEELEDDDTAWVNAKQAEQVSFMADAFESLKGWRAAENFTEQDVKDRAEAWGATLDGIYQEGKARGAGNVMLTFRRPYGVPAAKEPCGDCAGYEDERHSAKWWSKRNVFQRNGNPDFECGRWDGCKHELFTDKGELFSESA